MKTLYQLSILFTKVEKAKLFFLFVGMLLGALLEVIGIGAIPTFITLISTPEKVLSNEVLAPLLDMLGLISQKELLVGGSLFLITIFLIKNIYITALSHLKLKFVFNKQFYLSSKLFKRYMQAPYIYHINKNTAELLRNVHQECNMIIQQVLMPGITMLMDMILALAILCLLIVAEPMISFITFGFMAISSGIFLKYTNKKISRYGKLEVLYRRARNKSVLQSLSSIKDIKVLNRENFFINEYAQFTKESADAIRFKNFTISASKPFIETIAIVGVLMIILLMVWQGRSTSYIIPMLTLFGAAAIKLMPLVNTILSNFTNIKYGMHSIDPIVKDLTNLEVHSSRLDTRKAAEELNFKSNILIDKVSFKYPGASEKALKDIYINISKGESIGIVGSSGSGKTTLIDLILGVLDPTEGVIKVDEKAISTAMPQWSKKIGYIPQHISLLDESLINNIALGIPEPDIDIEQVKIASKLACLHDFIMEMPEQYHTIIGERGVRLSGGQRQRIGIARALYHNPEILVMDEATSALDTITEQIIVEAINNLKHKITTIIIAHRLTTIKDCDKIFLLKKGEIKDSGTYQELIFQNFEFKEMASEIS